MKLEIGKYYEFLDYPYSSAPVGHIGLYIGRDELGSYEFFFKKPIYSNAVADEQGMSNRHRCVLWDTDDIDSLIRLAPENEFQRQVFDKYDV